MRWNEQKKIYIANSTGLQASSRLLSMCNANALLLLPNGRGVLPRGTTVPAIVIGSMLSPLHVSSYAWDPSSVMKENDNNVQSRERFIIIIVIIIECDKKYYHVYRLITTTTTTTITMLLRIDCKHSTINHKSKHQHHGGHGG